MKIFYLGSMMREHLAQKGIIVNNRNRGHALVNKIFSNKTRRAFRHKGVDMDFK